MGKGIDMGKNKVYTASFDQVVAPGANFNTAFELQSWNRTRKLKSISLDIQVRNNATLMILPIESNTTQDFYLQFYAIPLSLYAEPFTDFTFPPLYNGNTIYITRPGQVFYDSFYLRHRAGFIFDYENRDAAITYRIRVTVTAETENIFE